MLHLLLLALGGGVKVVVISCLLLEAVITNVVRVARGLSLTLAASAVADLLALASTLLPLELDTAAVDAASGGVRNVTHCGDGCCWW